MAKHKRAAVVADGNDPPSAEKKRNFLEDIFRVLLHARRILSASYCIGYFIPEDLGEAVNAHETLQVGRSEILFNRPNYSAEITCQSGIIICLHKEF